MFVPDRTQLSRATDLHTLPDHQVDIGKDTVRLVSCGLDEIEEVRLLNRIIFGEERIINSFDKPDVLILLAFVNDKPAGFKIGYGESMTRFYSAKGGVLDGYRRRGIARMLLTEMESIVKSLGYKKLAYDTFPNRNPGMVILGLNTGFKVIHTDFNHAYHDHRIRLEKNL